MDVRLVDPQLRGQRLRGVALSAIAEVDPHLLIFVAPEVILIGDKLARDGAYLCGSFAFYYRITGTAPTIVGCGCYTVCFYSTRRGR
jgi:hypothetical protein